MTVKEALALLDKAIASVVANRETHVALQQALAVVAAAADPAEEKPAIALVPDEAKA